MLSKIFQKISTYADHHQAMFAMIIGFCAISISWGVEKILEKYVFPNESLYSYSAAILGGVLILWVTKHYLLHEL